MEGKIQLLAALPVLLISLSLFTAPLMCEARKTVKNSINDDDNDEQISVKVLDAAPEDCSVKAQNGDTVWINHKGFHLGQQIDMNPEGEPLKVALGKNRILRGMPLASSGEKWDCPRLCEHLVC